MGMQIAQVVFGQTFEGVNHGLGSPNQFFGHFIGLTFVPARNYRANGTKEKSNTTKIE